MHHETHTPHPSRRDTLLATLAAPFAITRAGIQETPAPGVDARRAARILRIAATFGRGGGYDRSWKSSGSPQAIEHGGATILRASDRGTYCCGFTFAVAMAALADAGALAHRSAADLKAFQKRWFGATDVAIERERQCAVAVSKLGVGVEVGLDAAMAGDFIQLWRVGAKPSGHSVLFLGWIALGRERIGLSYLSSQGSTDGIGYAVEYFEGASAGTGRVDPKRTYVARLDAAGGT